MSLTEAVKKLQSSTNKIKLPIGVIGGNKTSPEKYHSAEAIGRELAKLGLTVICGGRTGVM